MIRLIRELFFVGIWITGIPLFLKYFFQRKYITIVLFHDLAPKKAEMVFKYLVDAYNIISLDQLVKAIQNKQKLPPYSLVITFDDGRIRNKELFPYINNINIPITLFLSTSDERLDGEKFITKKDIEAVSQYFDIQSHTISHPRMPLLDDLSAAKEILEGKVQLEKLLHHNVNYFAFPYGEYSQRDIDILKESSFKGAVSVDPGYNRLRDSNIYTLKRICLSDNPTKFEMRVKATGLFDLIFRKSGLHNK